MARTRVLHTSNSKALSRAGLDTAFDGNILIIWHFSSKDATKGVIPDKASMIISTNDDKRLHKASHITEVRWEIVQHGGNRAASCTCAATATSASTSGRRRRRSVRKSAREIINLHQSREYEEWQKRSIVRESLTFNRSGPPQNSVLFPAQVMLQSSKEAGAPPLPKSRPQ